MPQMQVPMDAEKEQPKGMSTMQEATGPEIEHKVTHTGYGLAYERTDVSFIAVERVYINLKNPRYSVLGKEYRGQKEALEGITDLVDIRSLRKSIKAVGLQVPLEVIPFREGYKVIEGNRRRAALHLLNLETGQFTEVPVHILPDMNDEQVAHYLLEIHGVSRQKPWSPLAQWEVPYHYHSVLKYSAEDISKIIGIPSSTIKTHMRALDYLNQYRDWLKTNGRDDAKVDRRFTFFNNILHRNLANWFEKNKPLCFDYLCQDKLNPRRGGDLRSLPEITGNPALRQILESDGIGLALSSLMAIKGVKLHHEKQPMVSN